MRVNFPALVCISLFSATVAVAQLGIRGQIYLPNGEPLHKHIRFSLSTDNGARSDILFTDSNGRIEVSQPINVPYTITIQGDGESYDTTTASFDPAYSGRYIVIHLRPLKADPSFPPGVVDVSATDQKVSPKAKEAYDEALKMLQEKRYEQALEPLKRAISLQPNYFHAYNDLGVLNMRLNRLDDAADAFRHAIKINDRVYLPQLNLALVLNKQSKYKEAADVLIKLRHSHPNIDEKISPPMIEALMGSQQWPPAEEEIRKALGYEKADSVDLKIKMGMVLIKQEKYKEAVAVLSEATSAEPDNALAQFNLGTAQLLAGNLDQAETSLRRAYEIKGSEMPGAQLMLGQLYFQKKDYPKAIKSFETYLKDLPNAPNAAQVREAVAKLSRAVKQ